ncbi:MAG: hypothetical protein ACYC2P_05765 [Paludibacteraceae bacterium]
MKKFLLLLLIMPIYLFAQQSDYFDSLKIRIKGDLTDSAKYVDLLTLSENYTYNNPDSAIFYGQESIRFFFEK